MKKKIIFGERLDAKIKRVLDDYVYFSINQPVYWSIDSDLRNSVSLSVKSPVIMSTRIAINTSIKRKWMIN